MRCSMSVPWVGPLLSEPLGNGTPNPPRANGLFQQLSPRSYNFPNNELEAKFSVDLELSF